MVQKGFTLAVTVKNDMKDALSKYIIENKHRFDFRDKLDTLNKGFNNDDSTILCSVLTIPAQSKKTGKTLTFNGSHWTDDTNSKVPKRQVLPPMLLILTSFTGKTKDYVKELVAQNGKLIFELLSFCKVDDYEELGIPKKLEKFLFLNNRTSTFYSGQQYVSKKDILLEDAIFRHSRTYLTKNRNELIDKSPQEIKQKIKNDLLTSGNFQVEDFNHKTSRLDIWKAKWIGISELISINFFFTTILLLAFWTSLPIWITQNIGFNGIENTIISFFVFIGLMALNLLFLGIVYFLFLLILEKLTKQETDKELKNNEIKELLGEMTNDVFNEWSLAGPIKSSGWFFRIFANYISIKLAFIGLPLMTIPTVVNARWMGLNGFKRLTFFSNFMSQTEGYSREFVDQKVRGSLINLVYHHAEGYPKTKLIFGEGGKKYPESLVRDILYYQHPTEFWYAPIKKISNDNIKINHKVRKGLFTQMSDEDASKWLRLFSTWNDFDKSKNQTLKTKMPDGVNIDDIQALVASGHGKLRHGKYLFLKFSDQANAKAYLNKMLPSIIKINDNGDLNELHNIAFTHSGISFLDDDKTLQNSFQREFIEGMDDNVRSKILGDESINHPTNWSFGNKGEIHALLIVLAKEKEILKDLLADQEKHRATHGITLIKELDANLLQDNKEHFGFVDGISNPRIEGVHAKTEKGMREQLFLKPGEFILGYKNEYNNYSPMPKTDWTHANATKLNAIGILNSDVYCENEEYLFGKNGTYLVFRQMSQYVDRFWNYNYNKGGTEDAAIKLASKMVGRWPNGSPITKHENRNAPKNVKKDTDNNFLYFKQDQAGAGCPLGAHVRRANPRDQLITETNNFNAGQVIRKKQMIRRGRTYGQPVDPKMETKGIIQRAKTGMIKGERGLNFVALVSTISRQFEFVQSSWIQSPAFAGLRDENDPLIGTRNIAGKNERDNFTCPAHPFSEKHENIPAFTQVKGGGYFFLPGIVALKYLSK